MFDKFALPELANRVVEVNIPSGTELRFGIAKNQTLEDGSTLSGGGEQFEIVTNSIGDDPTTEWFPEETIKPL